MAFYVNFRVPELQETLNQLSAYDSKTSRKIENVVSKSTKAIGQGIKRRMPVASGYTKKHVYTRFNVKKITGEAVIKSPVAHLLEFGAKASVEVPDKKKAMTVDEFGIRRYAKKVHIPARSPHPTARPAFEDEKPNLIKGLKEAVQP